MPNAPRRRFLSLMAVAAVVALSGSACAAVGSAASSPPPTPPPSPTPAPSPGVGNPPGYLRVVRTIDQAWNVQCVNDPCSTTPRFTLDIPTPRHVQSFDLVLTVTMDYRTTPKDWATAAVFKCPALNPPPPCAFLLLDPGPFPLAPASTGGGSTISLSWSGKGLSAGYRAWRFELLITPMDGSGDNAVTITGRRVTAVFEMRPSG